MSAVCNKNDDILELMRPILHLLDTKDAGFISSDCAITQTLKYANLQILYFENQIQLNWKMESINSRKGAQDKNYHWIF